MRKKLHEIMGVPPEDQNRGTPEYSPLPDEYNRFTGTAAEEPTQEEQKPFRLRKVMLLLAAAGLATVGVFWSDLIETNPVEVPPTLAPTAVVEQPSETPTSTPAPTASPSPTPVVLTGKIHIVVYTDVFSMENLGEDTIYPCEILADETFDAETFTSYTLPPLPTQEGFTAQGYVLLAYPGMAYLQSLYFDGEAPREIGTVALGDTVTYNDLGIVPMNIDGVHEAEIHVVWLEDEGNKVIEFYDGGLFNKEIVGFPMYSEGLVYLAAFPKPEREGYTFAGWCDVNGNIVDAVTYFDFYEPLPGAQTLEDRDWSKNIPCRLFATWADASGEISQFEMQPDCRLIYYQTHSVSNAVVLLYDTEHILSVHVRIWEELVQDSVMEYDLTEDEIRFGLWEELGIDANDFYGKHMEEYEALGEFGVPVLEVTMTCRLDDGTEITITRVAEPKAEDYVSVYYDTENEEANDYTFPGCFVAAVYDTENPDFRISADTGETLQPGEITVSISVNGQEIPAALCRLKELVDIFEYEGVEYSFRTYYLVMQRPSSFPAHGRATVHIRQSFYNYTYQTERIYDLEY